MAIKASCPCAANRSAPHRTLQAGDRAPNPRRSRWGSKQKTGRSLQAWPNSRKKILLSPWAHHGQDRSGREAIARHDPGQPNMTGAKAETKTTAPLLNPPTNYHKPRGVTNRKLSPKGEHRPGKPTQGHNVQPAPGQLMAANCPGPLTLYLQSIAPFPRCAPQDKGAPQSP